MKRLVCLTLCAIFAVILGACAESTPQPVDEMINPGDKFGDFLVTTGDNENVTFLANIHCPLEHRNKIL